MDAHASTSISDFLRCLEAANQLRAVRWQWTLWQPGPLPLAPQKCFDKRGTGKDKCRFLRCCDLPADWPSHGIISNLSITPLGLMFYKMSSARKGVVCSMCSTVIIDVLSAEMQRCLLWWDLLMCITKLPNLSDLSTRFFLFVRLKEGETVGNGDASMAVHAPCWRQSR